MRVMHEAGVNVDVLAEMLDLVWEVLDLARDGMGMGGWGNSINFVIIVNSY